MAESTLASIVPPGLYRQTTEFTMAPALSSTTNSMTYNEHNISMSPLTEAHEEQEGATFKAPPSPPLPNLNIGQLLDAQHAQYPEREAIVSRWQDKRVTYRELHDTCRDIANSLLSHGVRPGDHIIVLAGNTIEYAQLFFAVGAIGAIFSIINPTFSAEEVMSAVNLLGMPPFSSAITDD